MIQWTPQRMRFLLNIYGPFLGAGVKVDRISSDWREIEVSMKLRWYNRNAVGTHFGGSLYSMVDPHLMLMLMMLLGRDYIVWDKSAEIEFVAPGKGRVRSTISISEEEVANVKEMTKDHSAFFPQFDLEVLDDTGNLVSKVKKILYVKRKSPAR